MRDKKYAVMYAPTANVGDDIQTLAAINFLKKKGVTKYDFVNREKLHEYNGEEVHLLMNGWFMHQPKNFPPSGKIKPIWISFHIARPQLIKNNLEFFKKEIFKFCLFFLRNCFDFDLVFFRLYLN